MKKLLLILFICLVVALPAKAAETMTIADKGFYSSDGSRIKTLSLLCTTDTDGSFSYQLTDSMFEYIRGWVIFEVRVTNTSAQTDPTANSDLTFPLAASGSFDLLYGGGANMVDNDAVNGFRPLDLNGDAGVISVVDKFFVEVANNSEDSAVFTLMLILYPTN